MNEEKRLCILNVEGMRCGACEAHVNDAIRKLPSVFSVKSSVRKKNCEILYKGPSKPDDFVNAIVSLGYDASLRSDEPYEKKGFFARFHH